MSPLTKIFVGLLVLLSVAFTAGVVTFINQLAPYRVNNESLTLQLADAKARALELSSQVAAADARVAEAVAGRQEEAAKLTAEMTRLRQDIEKANTQIAALNSAAVLANANIGRMTAALTASEGTKGLLTQQVADSRAKMDEIQKQNVEQSTRISTLTRELAVTEAARRNFAEQVTELTNMSKKQAAMLMDLGATDTQITSLGNSGTGAGAPALNGVIRDRRTIAGKEYATISLGSEDSVKPKMQFKILEKGTGRFLGMLTIDNVDSNEAIGQIQSDNMAAITAGSEVRTQL